MNTPHTHAGFPPLEHVVASSHRVEALPTWSDPVFGVKFLPYPCRKANHFWSAGPRGWTPRTLTLQNCTTLARLCQQPVSAGLREEHRQKSWGVKNAIFSEFLLPHEDNMYSADPTWLSLSAQLLSQALISGAVSSWGPCQKQSWNFARYVYGVPKAEGSLRQASMGE